MQQTKYTAVYTACYRQAEILKDTPSGMAGARKNIGMTQFQLLIVLSLIPIQYAAACSLGYYTTNGGGTCTPCAKGKIASTTNPTSCTPCDFGSYAATTGLSDCTPCSPGTYAPSNGLSACKTCPLSQYTSSSGSMACTYCASQLNCPANQYAAACSGAADIGCVPNSTVVAPGYCSGDASCSATLQYFVCSSNNSFQFSYSTYPKTTCYTSTTNPSIIVQNASAISVVISLTASFSFPNSYSPFTPTYFELDTGSSTIFSTSSTITENGQSIIYNQGNYNLNLTYEVPVNLFYIAFNPAKELVSYFTVSYSWRFPCANCPANQYAYGCNAASTGQCLPCPAGTYSSSGSTSCSPIVCSDNYYILNNVCTPCPTGYYSNSGSIFSCTACAQNNYVSNNVCIPCSTCFNGYYNQGCGGTNPGTCIACSNS